MDIIQCNLLVKIKRKWKSRWVVLRRVNPASERINLYVYKDRLSAISKHKEKFFLSLREFCGMESVDKENKSPKLIIITVSQPLSLRFETKADRDYWVDTIVTEGNFGEDATFDGVVPSKQTLRSGEVTLHIYPDFFALVRKQNSRCLGRWKFEQLFNYGTVEGGFVFRIENEDQKSSEPESYLFLTSLEKQINRTFDTVYKTARHMYGSAEGLQRPAKFSTPSAPRPRSMSEPSGFKRFMQRLSFRRKSRRPNPKWKTDSFNRRLNEDGSPATPQGGSPSREGSRLGKPESSAAEHLENKLSSISLSDGEHQADGSSAETASSPSESVFADVRRSPSNDASDGLKELSKTDENRENVTCLMASVDIGLDQSHRIPKDKQELISNGEADRKHEPDIAPRKKTRNVMEPLSGHDAVILRPAGSKDDLSVWQRRSALLLNTDDMIEQGFIKAKSFERCSGADPPAVNKEGNNNAGRQPAVPKTPGEGTGIQVRRNTSSPGMKRPILTIEITPSGSDPSLNQYVNVPAETVKNKRIHKLKQGEWDKYDSEENVYHHLADVVGRLGYQNVPEQGRSQSVASLDKSYQNVPTTYPAAGHSYENVAGARGDMHYINVEATKQQSVNYIKVAGSGPPTPIQKNSNHLFGSRAKGNPDYTEIDIVKTRRLRELAQETKERVKKS